LLVLAVPILFTMARKDWYLSSSDHCHYLIDSSKTKVAYEPILPDRLIQRSVVLAVPPQPVMQTQLSAEATTSQSSSSPSLTAPLHYRAPPIFMA
jgi:hypothetical protein